MKKLFLVCLLMALCCATALAQGRRGSDIRGAVGREKTRPQVPAAARVLAVDKSDCGEPLFPVEPGDFKLKYLFLANSTPRDSNDGTSTIRAPVNFFMYATSRVFVEADLDTVISLKESASDRVTGVGDTVLNLGGDVVLEQKCKKHPSFSAMYSIKLPSASSEKGLGSGEIDHQVLGWVGKSFGKDLHSYAEVDFGGYFAKFSDKSGYASTALAAVIFEQILDAKEKFTLHLEVDGASRTGDTPGELYTINWLQTEVHRHVQFRVGARVGITPASPKVGFYGGIVFKGNLFK